MRCAAILAGAEPLPEEMVALDTAYHRVLARDVAALRTQPPQAMSAMDGYAVRAADAAALSARLKVIGEVAAGRPFDRKVGARRGRADLYRRRDPRRRRRRHHPGRHCASMATTSPSRKPPFRDGTSAPPASTSARAMCCLPAGSRLTDRDLSLAAGMNYPELAVRRRPKVAVLATGDELVMPGSIPGPGQIVYSNGYALRALARAEGAETIDLGIAADTVEATTRRHPPRPRRGRRYPDHHRRRLGRRPRPRQAVAGGRRRHHGVLADRDAAGQADDARTARRACG